jgi:hypothetical protein
MIRKKNRDREIRVGVNKEGSYKNKESIGIKWELR